MSREINIAFLGHAFLRWGGGIDFLRNCSNSLLLKNNNHSIRIYILIPENSIFKKFKLALLPYKNMAEDLLNLKRPRFTRPNQIDKALLDDFLKNLGPKIQPVYYVNSRKKLISSLRGINADVVLPCTDSLGDSFPIPWIGYIYDFQHKYLPNFFTDRECSERDRINGKLVREAKAIIVNSKAVKDDVSRFYENATCRIFSLPFAPVPDDSWFGGNPSDMKAKYNLPERYFLMSNQFWIHKSHMTAFEALAKLRKTEKSDIHIVCTGKMKDYRFPNYFEELQSKIVEMNLTDKIQFLDYIPKDDQIQIMRGALAVLQPTLFEGGPGGGAVYDAVAMGVPAIVSDIPVNVEIEHENILFFKTGSADDMSLKMMELLNAKVNQPEPKLLRAEAQRHAEKLGSCLLEAIGFVVGTSEVSSTSE